MELLLKHNPNAGYEENDIVFIADDGAEWGSGELDTNVFTIQKGADIPPEERRVLLMRDEGLNNFQAISKLPAFRSISTKAHGMKLLHNRKYQWLNNEITIKPNAQER